MIENQEKNSNYLISLQIPKLQILKKKDKTRLKALGHKFHLKNPI